MQAITRRTPSSTLTLTNGATAKAAGDIVVQGSLVGYTTGPVAANAEYTATIFLHTEAEIVKDNGNMATPGTAVYWNASGNPVGGTAGSGAATLTASTHELIGYTKNVAGATAGTVLVALTPLI